MGKMPSSSPSLHGETEEEGTGRRRPWAGGLGARWWPRGGGKREEAMGNPLPTSIWAGAQRGGGATEARGW